MLFQRHVEPLVLITQAVVAVAGTHGKTTTSAMLSVVMQASVCAEHFLLICNFFGVPHFVVHFVDRKTTLTSLHLLVVVCVNFQVNLFALITCVPCKIQKP